MEIGKSFSYVFEDPRWVSKVAIGGAILLVGTILIFLLALPTLAALIIVLGYMLTVVRNVSEGSTSPLPEWTDFGALFMKGLYAAIGIVVVYIPAIVLVCCGVLASTALTSAASASSDNSGGAAGALGIVAICFQCLYALYAIIAAIYIYAPMTRYALGGQMSTFWDIRGNLAFIQANIGGYVIALIMTLVAAFIGQLGFILCIIPGFFTWFWSYLVSAHIFGQFARGTPNMNTMAPMAPPPMAPVAPAQ